MNGDACPKKTVAVVSKDFKGSVFLRFHWMASGDELEFIRRWAKLVRNKSTPHTKTESESPSKTVNREAAISVTPEKFLLIEKRSVHFYGNCFFEYEKLFAASDALSFRPRRVQGSSTLDRVAAGRRAADDFFPICEYAIAFLPAPRCSACPR